MWYILVDLERTIDEEDIMEKKKFTKEMVDHYADDLLIGLTSEENEMVLNEFEEIDANIDLINKIPGIEKIKPMSWCLDRTIDSLREDVALESISIEDALSNSDGESGDVIEVPKVVG